jgi:transcriptional regulator of acetoin/glycerol metabolism
VPRGIPGRALRTTVLDVLAGGGPDADVRRRTIREALLAHGGNVSRTARRLGIHRTTLWFHLQALGMDGVPERVREEVRRRYLVG